VSGDAAGGGAWGGGPSKTSRFDLLFLAIYPHGSSPAPPGRPTQRIAVIDASALSSKWVATGGADGPPPGCTVLQELVIDPRELSGPHLLGVDPSNGDLYAALVADEPRSTVLRYRLTDGGAARSLWSTTSTGVKVVAVLLFLCLLGGAASSGRRATRRRAAGAHHTDALSSTSEAAGADGSHGLRGLRDEAGAIEMQGTAVGGGLGAADRGGIPSSWNELNPAARLAAEQQGEVASGAGSEAEKDTASP
jgi:hypothetical protein